MAFNAKNFVLCSKTPLFKADAKLWLYSTADTLEDCLAENYFKPRENLNNQDSPEVGDVIQLIVENSKLAYLKITAKTEKPYNITVARTFLENEATLIAELAKKADKETDFVTPITNLNKGITQVEQEELSERIDLAINSGSMITQQGVWYAKMDAGTTPPSADEGATYADFSQTDQDSNPIIVIYTYTSGVWTQTSTVTPPASTDGYVAVTLKFWDIPQQSGQQGGRVLWNHTAKTFTPFPTIISYNDVTLTGDSTVVMPDTPSDGQIISLEYFKEHMRGAGRNVGDIFYTSRKDTEINGAVACDGSTYQTTDYMGSEAPGALLTANKLPYVSLADYAQLLTDNGSVGVFGWDGIGTTAFRVPTLTDIFLETGTLAQLGNYLAPGLPSVEHTHGYTIQDVNETTGENSGTGTGISFGNVDKTTSENSALSEIYGNSDTVQPNAIRYRAMVQLYTGVSDNAQIAVNDSTITITQGGVTKGSFTLNQPNNETIVIDVSDFPSQTGQSGKFLTTDGTSPSWASLATVATTGAYGDLIGTPTIGNATITITQGGAIKGSFTTNQTLDTTIEIDAGGGGPSLPDQTGHSGEFLTTNGTAASWGAAPVTSVNSKTGAVTLTASDVGALPDSTVVPVTEIGASINGSLTVNGGDVSGFYSDNYLKFPGSLDMTGASSFEIVFAFTKTIGDGAGYLLSENPVSVLSDKHLTFMASTHLRFDVNDGSNYQTLEGTTTFSANVKYYGKIAYDGTNYTLSLSTDGVTYTTEDTAVAQYIPGVIDYNYLIGRVSTGFSNIHLSESYIKKNGILIWQGVDAPGLHQRAPVGREIVAIQEPTVSNDYTWYRKYADGWVEQGGRVDVAVTQNVAASWSVTFPIAMNDLNYSSYTSLQSTYVLYTSGGAEGRTTTGFSGFVENTSDSTIVFVFWKVDGFAA